jgi:hypothetical protein
MLSPAIPAALRGMGPAVSNRLRIYCRRVDSLQPGPVSGYLISVQHPSRKAAAPLTFWQVPMPEHGNLRGPVPSLRGFEGPMRARLLHVEIRV